MWPKPNLKHAKSKTNLLMSIDLSSDETSALVGALVPARQKTVDKEAKQVHSHSHSEREG